MEALNASSAKEADRSGVNGATEQAENSRIILLFLIITNPALIATAQELNSVIYAKDADMKFARNVTDTGKYAANTVQAAGG